MPTMDWAGAVRLALPFALVQLLATVAAQAPLNVPKAVATETITSLDTQVTAKPALSTAPRSQSSTFTPANSTSSRGPQIHTVKVGAGAFKYDPQELHNVSAGDTITFEFYPPDHSVARAEFESSCVPYEYTGPNKTGFWSDTQNVSTVNDLTHWNLTINSTEPIFYYCAAPGSCKDHQMVGVINPNSTQTLERQIQAAKDASFALKPGDPVPQEGSASLHTPSATASPTSTGAAATNNDNHSHTLSGGAIAGIVVGAVAFLIICAALFFYVGRAKSLKEVLKHRISTIPSNTTPEAGRGQEHHFEQQPMSSPGWSSPSYPTTPFSPPPAHAEFDGGQLPAYGQHNATDAHPTIHPGHVPPMTEAKEQYPQGPVEMASPSPGQQAFRAELEAPLKTVR